MTWPPRGGLSASDARGRSHKNPDLASPSGQHMPSRRPFPTHETELEQAMERTGIEPVTSGLQRRLRVDLRYSV